MRIRSADDAHIRAPQNGVGEWFTLFALVEGTCSEILVKTGSKMSEKVARTEQRRKVVKNGITTVATSCRVKNCEELDTLVIANNTPFLYCRCLGGHGLPDRGGCTHL